MRSSTTSLRLQRQRVQSVNLSLTCASAGAMLTGACLLSLAAQTEIGISAVWAQSSLVIACLLCAVIFSIAGVVGALAAPKGRHTALNGFALILSACSLLGQLALLVWA